jgi:hypothetical protein
MMQVLQLAQDDLKRSGVAIMFTQIRFPVTTTATAPPARRR